MESAPKDGTHILLYGKGFGTGVGRTGKLIGWVTLPGAYKCHPTHWMPLPDPPAALALTAGETG